MKIINKTRSFNDAVCDEYVINHIKRGEVRSIQSSPVGNVIVETTAPDEYTVTYKYKNYGRLD